MFKGTPTAGCSRFGMTDNFVPFQPNVERGRLGQPARRQGRRDPLRRRETGPGRAAARARSSTSRSRASTTRPARRSRPRVHLQSGGGALPAGTVALTVPAGWTWTPRSRGRRRRATETTVTFNVTPASAAARTRTTGSPRSTRAARPRATPTTSSGSSPRRGPLPALGQLAGVRPVARRHGAGGQPARPLGGDPDDGRGRDVDAAGRRPQLVRHDAERHGLAGAAGQRDGRRDVEALCRPRAGRRDDGQLQRVQLVHERDPAGQRTRAGRAEHERQRPHHHHLQQRRHRLRGPDAGHRAQDDGPGRGGRADA